MILIKLINTVTKVRYYSEPDEWKLHKLIDLEIDLPMSECIGQNFKLEFCCTNCQSLVKYHDYYNSHDILLSIKLHYDSLRNKPFLKILGELFGLNLTDKGVDENLNDIFFYDLKDKIARVNYFKCNHCKAKYFLAKSYHFGDERPPVPNILNIAGVYQIEFDESLFSKLIRNPS